MAEEEGSAEVRARELTELDAGVDPEVILHRRVDAAVQERDRALQDLRAVMSDAEVLENFGIDLSQL